tara:strand:+ start:62 stop:745 length:684 start_codon:yes stop_codon:yes gene_type:complete
MKLIRPIIQKRVDWKSNRRFEMSCVSSNNLGLLEHLTGGTTDIYVWEGDSSTGQVKDLAAADVIAGAVLNIAANNGDYRQSNAITPFKFQWCDVSTAVSKAGSISCLNIETANTKIAVANDTVIPVYDHSSDLWLDVRADGLAAGVSADRVATCRVDTSPSDGDALDVAVLTVVGAPGSESVTYTEVTTATADYYLAGTTSSKPFMLLAGCEGSATNDATGGSLGGP